MNVQERLLEERIDPYLTRANLSVLATRALDRSVSVSGIRTLTGGCWNRVIAAEYHSTAAGSSGGEVVIKIAPDLPDLRLIREFRVLRYFAGETSMPVPTPNLIDDSGELIPGTVLVMSMLPGVVLHEAYGSLDRTSRDAVSRQIAEHVVDLHRTRKHGFGGVELRTDERCERWSEFWLPRFDTVIEEVRSGDVMPDRMLDEIALIEPGFPAALDIDSSATLTHYDIWSGNVMIDPDTRPARVTGFIDIPGFFADYAREISFMLMFGMADETFFRIYRDTHEIDRGFENRINIYNLKMHLKHVTMYPHESYYREGARRCLEYLQRNL